MEDDLVIVDFAAAERGAARRGRQIEPWDVFHRSTSLADKMMVTVQVGVEAGGLTIRHHLAHQAGFGQGAQVIVDSGAGSPRIVPVHRAKDFNRGGMDGSLRQELQHGIALRRGAQGSVLECLVEFGS